MKTWRCCIKGGELILLFLFLIAGVAKVCAQSNDGDGNIPVVTIQATDPVAWVNVATNQGPFIPSGKLGMFTVFRHGNTNEALNVYYQIGGTASNGVDYARISNWVTIPAGATSNSIPILPLVNSLKSSVAKTVNLQLAPPLTMTPINFQIGNPSNAVVLIEYTNVPPLPPFDIYLPRNGAVFYTPTNVQISAEMLYLLTGSFFPTNVEFFAGTNDLGKGLGVASPTFAFDCSLIWTNPPLGDYALSAVATSGDGMSITSAPVNITVLQGPPPPSVNIIQPENGDVFYMPTNVQIMAKAADAGGNVTNVEFFAGTNDLGVGNEQILDPPGVNGNVGLVYVLNWPDVAAGKYALTAVATDDGGISTTSAPVNITVEASPPPTNPPPPLAVRIISPPNGAVFRAPINLPLFAFFTYPHGPDDYASVGFYDGTNFLGTAQPVSRPTPLPLTPGGPTPGPIPVPPTALSTNIYELVWTNATVGNDVLTAEASGGNSNNCALWRIASKPVHITILPPVPPPTNRPAVVTIVATDPVAVEGTNSWIWAGETNATPTWAAWPPAVRCPFTNSGPNDAIFAVHRFGDTNNDLTVNYEVGGTASNGVDYVELPGWVTVPAGQRDALINVVPIDDGPPDINKTVILTLTPPTNTPPDYVPGFPRRAAAVIIDSDKPRPVTGLLPGHYFHLVAPGPDAAWFCVEYSTNLVNWTPICTNQVVNGSIDFVDPNAADSAGRFYRILPLTNAP